MRQLQVRNRSDCRNPPLKTAPATRWEADVHNRAKTRFPRQGARNRADTTSRMKKEARRSAKPPFCPSWAETTSFADQTTKAQPIERCTFNNAAKPNRPLGAIVAGKSNRLRNTFNNAAKPNRSHRTIDNATRPNQTHRAANAALRPNSTRGAAGHAVNTAPPAQQPTRRHRPHAPKPHAHRATDEYPGPGSAHSRASPSRARGTHRRARARSPRPRRPAAPRTPARAHASSR